MRVGILTSGGDAPGMNSALRAVAKVGAALGLDVVGVEDGYVGLLEGRLRSLSMREVDDAFRKGGTVLGSARSKVFPTPEGQARARETILREKLSGLLVIGGNGSLTGALALCDAKTFDGATLRVAGIPASIDNDLGATALCIGVDTAMNTIVEACDRICDTATAHRRTFIVEVMGRDSGYLAMTSAIAAGADAVLLPESGKTKAQWVEQVARAMEAAYQRDSGKRRVLVIKAEGVKLDCAELKAAVDERVRTTLPGADTRVTVLGHVVRGGVPTALDRLLASRLGNAAIRALADGQSGFMAGWFGPGVTNKPSPYDPQIVFTPLKEVLEETARMLRGETELARWRRKVFDEAESILLR
jgi:6-phosphofructokinase 1